jgi:hypothetical protein
MTWCRTPGASSLAVLGIACFYFISARLSIKLLKSVPPYERDTNKLRGREREKGIKAKMKVKLAAKLLIIAWTLMKKKEPFDPEYLNID